MAAARNWAHYMTAVIVFPMLAPLGLSELIVAVWLITKGFRDQPSLRMEPGDL